MEPSRNIEKVNYDAAIEALYERVNDGTDANGYLWVYNESLNWPKSMACFVFAQFGGIATEDPREIYNSKPKLSFPYRNIDLQKKALNVKKSRNEQHAKFINIINKSVLNPGNQVVSCSPGMAYIGTYREDSTDTHWVLSLHNKELVIETFPGNNFIRCSLSQYAMEGEPTHYMPIDGLCQGHVDAIKILFDKGQWEFN